MFSKFKFKKIAKTISLILVSTFMLTTITFAKPNDIIANESLINYNNKQYDLSNLMDAKQYFEDTGKVNDILKDVTASELQKSINDLLENVDEKQSKDPNYKEYLQILVNEDFFDAFSIDITNSNIEKSESYNIILDNVNPINDISIDATSIEGTSIEGMSIEGMSTQSIFFPLQSYITTNTQTMYNVYNATYNAFSSSDGAVVAAQKAYTAVSGYFANNEREGGAWDYKGVVGWDTIKLVKMDKNSKPNVNTYAIYGEDIGNIHYGYVGRTFYPAWMLRSAAGLIQILSNGVNISQFNSYFDDPNDQLSINMGINYFDTGYFTYVQRPN